jgi:hypothetical protein
MHARIFRLFREQFSILFGTKDCCALTFIALHFDTSCCAWEHP